MSSEAERSLNELQSALDSNLGDGRSLARASDRVAAALASLTREGPPADLDRLIDLHACVRDAALKQRNETARELQSLQSERQRLAHLTRPSDASGAVDYTV